LKLNKGGDWVGNCILDENCKFKPEEVEGSQSKTDGATNGRKNKTEKNENEVGKKKKGCKGKGLNNRNQTFWAYHNFLR